MIYIKVGESTRGSFRSNYISPVKNLTEDTLMELDILQLNRFTLSSSCRLKQYLESKQ